MKKKVKIHAPAIGASPGHPCVQMQKSQAQAQRQRNRRVPGQLPQTDGRIAQAQAQVEAGSLQLPQRDEAVDSGVQQQHFVEDRQMGRPRALKPAQIDRQAQHGQNQKIPPVAALVLRQPAPPAKANSPPSPATAHTTQTSPSGRCRLRWPPADMARTKPRET